MLCIEGGNLAVLMARKRCERRKALPVSQPGREGGTCGYGWSVMTQMLTASRGRVAVFQY